MQREIGPITNEELVNAICSQSRPLIKSKRDVALRSLANDIHAKNLGEVMVEAMGCAQWIRADLELLLRAAFWLTLSVDELRNRIVLDQKDLMQKFQKRLGLRDGEIESLLTRHDELLKSLPSINKRVENNAQILEHAVWHKAKLAKLYGHFHGRLSKLSHPDPFFLFFPEALGNQIPEFLLPDFSLCASELDKEWRELEEETKAS